MAISDTINSIQKEINYLLGKAALKVVIKYGELSILKILEELDYIEKSLPDDHKKYASEARELIMTFQTVNNMNKPSC